MAYSEKVLDHFKHPKNVGTLDKNDLTVGTGLVGAPECGDVMRLQIKVNPSTNTIEDAKFKTFGCGSAIASSSLATEWLKGKSLSDDNFIFSYNYHRNFLFNPVWSSNIISFFHFIILLFFKVLQRLQTF